MGVAPHINWLYSDLTDGLVIFQLYDIIRPGIVNWKKVIGINILPLKLSLNILDKTGNIGAKGNNL